MKHEWNDKTLVVYPVGEITSVNSEALRTEIFAFLKEQPCEKLVLDMIDLAYISSAGLRVLLSLKKEVGDITAFNASHEVYEVLEITGFTKIIKVRRALVDLDISSATKIGEGRTGIVYRINKDTIVKVYKRDVSIESIDREMELSRESFVLGIPTAITFDIVRVNGKLGTRFEMLDCKTLDEEILAHPEKFEEYLDNYTNLLKKVHSTEDDFLPLPSKKEAFIKHAKNCLPFLSEEQGEKLLKLFSAIPEAETFVHGDIHIKNIMTDGNDLYLIDMGSLSKGYPIFDLAALYRTFYGFDLGEPGNTERFFEMPRDLLDRIYAGVMKRYFNGNYTEETADKIALVGLAYLLSWGRRYEGDDSAFAIAASKALPPLVEKVEDLTLPL